MFSYFYEDRDGDRLLVKAADDSAQNAAYIVSNNGIGVYVPAAEAPKAAQAILDASGVQGAVVIDANFSNTVTVKIDASDIVKQIAFFKDLPEVTVKSSGIYYADYASHNPNHSTDINERILSLVAIKLRMEADAKEAEGAKLTQQIKEAADFRANTKAAEEAAAKKAHDDLRTSPIALKALAIYNRAMIGRGPYKTWDATNLGKGSPDNVVRAYIRRAEAEEAKEKEAAEKLAARRDQLAKELCDGTSIGPWYEAMGTVHKRAIDRIIELEDAK